MELFTEDGKRNVNIGNSETWYSVYSTLMVRTGGFVRKVPYAVEFFKSAGCSSERCLETARQINLVRDKLSNYSPEEAVYDMNDLAKRAPWEGNISPVVTSCANLYITADGKDLLFEIVSILTYGAYMKTAVCVR